MKGFAGVMDNAWFPFLSQPPGIDYVNFWQPKRKNWKMRAELNNLIGPFSRNRIVLCSDDAGPRSQKNIQIRRLTFPPNLTKSVLLEMLMSG